MVVIINDMLLFLKQIEKKFLIGEHSWKKSAKSWEKSAIIFVGGGVGL